MEKKKVFVPSDVECGGLFRYVAAWKKFRGKISESIWGGISAGW